MMGSLQGRTTDLTAGSPAAAEGDVAFRRHGQDPPTGP